MTKDNKFTIRTTPIMGDWLNIVATKKGYKTISDYVRDILIKDIEQESKGIISQSVIQQERLKLNKKKQSNELKAFLGNAYLFKNLIKNIMELALTEMFLCGEINPQIAQEIITQGELIYNCFPKETQERLKPQLEGLKKFNDGEYILQKVNMAMGKYLEDMKKIKLQ